MRYCVHIFREWSCDCGNKLLISRPFETFVVTTTYYLVFYALHAAWNGLITASLPPWSST